MSKRFLLLVILGFIVNAILEYQFVLLVEPFVETSRMTATIFISLIDTLFLFFVYWTLSLHKITGLHLKQMLIIVTISIVTVITAEWLDTSMGIWEYKNTTITLPYTNTILAALIHYSFLPLAVFYILSRFTKPA